MQNLLKAFKKVKVPRRYVSNIRGGQSGTSSTELIMMLSVVCCVEREKMYTALLSSNRKGKNKHFSCSACHELDRQPYPVDILSAYTRT